MRLLQIVTPALLLGSSLVNGEWYAVDSKNSIPSVKPFQIGQSLPVDCISRQIDNGEHKFDADGNIVYEYFPKCRETGESLSIKYGINEDLNCTIGLTDHLFHLFQLYIHQDAPYSCRLPISSEPNSISHGGSVPFTINFRGHISESHLDIDTNLNVLLSKPDDFNTIVSSVAWSSSTNTTRYVIGDFMTVQLSIRWLNHVSKNDFKPFSSGFYKLPMNINGTRGSVIFRYILLTAIITAAAVSAAFYSSYSIKFKKQYFRPIDSESVYAKTD